jgi:hypothetical protein
MADLVQRATGIDEHVGAIVNGVESFRRRAARHGASILGIAERLFAFFATADVAIRASEQYALLPSDLKWDDARK